jgi:hypothetical protein
MGLFGKDDEKLESIERDSLNSATYLRERNKLLIDPTFQCKGGVSSE